MIDISDLSFLTASSAAPSLAAAARNLNVTPPAVSQRLAILEDRLHLRLVERGRGPIKQVGRQNRATTRGKLIDVNNVFDAKQQTVKC